MGRAWHSFLLHKCTWGEPDATVVAVGLARRGSKFYPESLVTFSGHPHNNEEHCVCPQECLSLFITKPCLDTLEPLINLLTKWTPPGSHYWGTHSLWRALLLPPPPFSSLTPTQPSEGSSCVAQCFPKSSRLLPCSQRTSLYIRHCSLWLEAANLFFTA